MAGGKTMSKFHVVLVVLCAVIAASPATAAPKKRMSSIDSIRLACAKEAGAYRSGDGRWYVQGGIGTAQMQRFYDCLDAHTMKRR
jgi:hypothetical protein